MPAKKPGLWANINRRKKLGISRPKSKSTISKKAYANMLSLIHISEPTRPY